MLNVNDLTPQKPISETDAPDTAMETGDAAAVSPAETTFAEPSADEEAVRITLDQLVNLCIEKEASDIHFREGGRAALRVGGKMIFIENINILTKREVELMINSILTSEEEKKRFENFREIDFSYTHSNGVNFRVNLFYQKDKLAGVMRMISKHIPSMEELGIPEIIKDILTYREGLILVCGTAGSGKSTSIQSMLQYINNNFVKHIVTVENPIEYVYEDRKSMVTQREVGKDTLTFDHALRSAIREDANIVMVSEINNYEILDDVLDLVETGHLVIATMLTKDASQTVERMVSFYPPDQRKRAQDRIASDLIAVVAQDLVQKKDQTGQIALFELMFMNQSISQIIKRGNFVQLRSAIQSGAEAGMITMDSYASELARHNLISQEIASEYAQKEE